MAVDYLEVNMQLVSTACQPTLFLRLWGNVFMLKWSICGDITNYSSKVTVIITLWGLYRFHDPIWYINGTR